MLEDDGGDALCGGFVYVTPELKLLTRLLETSACCHEMAVAVRVCEIVSDRITVEVPVLACA